MAVIVKKVQIKAPIDDVFDLISDVTAFKDYATHIKDIKDLGNRHYRWHIVLLGFHLKWDAKVLVHNKPTDFKWQSLTGFENSGNYKLRKIDDNLTEVVFTMRYSFGSFLPLRIASHLISPLLEKGIVAFLNTIEHKLAR